MITVTEAFFMGALFGLLAATLIAALIAVWMTYNRIEQIEVRVND